jgi:hypothetical protein
MTQPNFSSNPRRISSGSEAPPEMQVRSVVVWAVIEGAAELP